MDDSSEALDFEPTALLLAEAEAGRQRIAAAAVGRLDRTALLSFLSDRGIPPAPWPAWIRSRPLSSLSCG